MIRSTFSYTTLVFPLVCIIWCAGEWSEPDACFCLQVINILPLRGGPPPKFSQRTQLITDNYQVVWLPDKRHDSKWTASYWWASISFFCSNGFFPCDKVISFQSSYDWYNDFKEQLGHGPYYYIFRHGNVFHLCGNFHHILPILRLREVFHVVLNLFQSC